MLAPKKSKYRKQFKIRRITGVATKGNTLAFGEFGLKAKEPGTISARQIEAGRRAITHFIRRGGRVWIRIFPDRPYTKKPPETRMGGGKGDIEGYVVPVKTGRIIFEMSGVTQGQAFEALRLAAHKLPIKTTLVKKEKI